MEVDLDPHPVAGLVLQLGDTEKFPHAHGFESLHPFFFFFSESASRVHVSQPCGRMDMMKTQQRNILHPPHLPLRVKVIPDKSY